MKLSTTVTGRMPAPRNGSENSRDRTVHEVIDRRGVRSVFQPLVDLDSGQVLGYEALARGAAGSPVESPLALFAAAAAVGRTVELDWVCRAAAYRAALAAGLHRSVTLFVNNEPVALNSRCPADLLPVVTRAEERLRIVSEMTEHALAADPAGLLAATARARAVGWGVALDDVGAEPGSLAFLPFVRPDVVKLDLRLIQDRTTAEVARIVNAVLAETETLARPSWPRASRPSSIWPSPAAWERPSGKAGCGATPTRSCLPPHRRGAPSGCSPQWPVSRRSARMRW